MRSSLIDGFVFCRENNILPVLLTELKIVMTRDQQLAFCKKCTNRKMDMKEGILCNLTGRKADFQDECPDFTLDESVKLVEEEPIILERDELRAQISPEQLEKLRSEQNFSAGFFTCLIVGLFGAILWAMITVATDFQIGYMALAIGAGVGFSMRYFGKGVDQKFGITGAIVALLSCVLGNIFTIIGVFANELGVGFFEMALSLNYSLLPEVMLESSGPITLLFYGIATFEGYKFSFRPFTKKQLAEI